MADAAQKIITGNVQPRTGRAVVAIAGCKALTAAQKLASNILSPDLNKDQPVALIDARLDGKFDDITYYTDATV